MNFARENTAFVENGNGQAHLEPFVQVDMAEEIDSLEDILLERFGSLSTKEAIKQISVWHQQIVEVESEKVQARIIKACVGLLLDCKNPKLQAFGIAFAAGLDHLAGITMTQASVELHVTKAAISKVTIKACEFLGLPKSRYMKTQKAAEAYRKRATEVHRRNGH